MAAMDYEPLSHDIGELRAMRDRLVAALTESIVRLRTLGTCPSSDVLDTAGRYRHQYQETRQRLSQERCAALAGPTASLEEWEQAIRLAQRQQQVTDLLNDAEAFIKFSRRRPLSRARAGSLSSCQLGWYRGSIRP